MLLAPIMAPEDKPVGVHCVGGARDLVEGVGNAIRLASRQDRIMEGLEPLRPKLVLQIGLAAYAFRRDRGIKKKRTPVHFDLDAVKQANGLVQAPLAEKAPRADDI